MTQAQYIINRKLNIVELGESLGNISEACRRLGVSRQHYYDIKQAIEQEGLEGLLEKSRKMPRVGNRVAPEIEQKVLDYSLQFPTHGQTRVANELNKAGLQISAGGVRSIWLRHDLAVKALRLKRLEKWAAENTGILTESQVQALEAAKEEKEACGEVESPHPGFLVNLNV
jgi:transposase